MTLTPVFWQFETIKPGPVGSAAPYLSLWIVARGINIGLNTRLYFPEETEANANDPVLALIEDPVHKATLIAERCERGDDVVYRFDIILQGEGETVFFDI